MEFLIATAQSGLSEIAPVVIAVAVIVCVVAAGSVLFLLLEKKRREALAALAAGIGFSFSVEDPGNIPGNYGHVECFQRGRHNKAKNILTGESDGVRYSIFDYRYVTGSGKSSTTHRMTVCVADVPQNFPKTLIRPEGFLDKVAAVAGFEDIDFSGTMEAHEFSKKYYVSSQNKEFAVKLITEPIREVLLRNKGLTVHAVSQAIAFVKEGRSKPCEFADLLSTARDFVARIPREASDRYMP